MVVKFITAVLVLLVAAYGKPSNKKNFKKEISKSPGNSVCSVDMQADVMFVFDAAGIGASKTNKIEDYISDVVGELSVDEDMIKVGVVSRNCHNGNRELRKYSDSNGFAKDLENQELLEFSHVIHKMRRHSFTLEHGGRPNVRRISVVFVDNKLESPEKVFTEVQMAKDGDIEVFVVGIGDDVDMAEVKTIATSPDHVIEIPDYDVLKATSSRLVHILCAGV